MNKYLIITMILSISGSVLILGISLLQKLLHRKLSMRFRYYVWLLVALRMLIPFSPTFSALYHAGYGLEELQHQLSVYEHEVYENELNYSLMQEEQRAGALPPSKGLAGFIPYLWTTWLAVALAMLIRKITLYQSFAKFVRAGRKEVANIEQLNFISNISEQLDLRSPVDVYTNDLINSPMIIGIWRPHIVLPTFSVSDRELCHIYLHELIHLKRRDIYYKWLMQVIQCLHWFNPLVYYMVRQINRYCELSCDEAVIDKLGEQESSAYGTTLLSSLNAAKTYQEPIAAFTMSESAIYLQERLNEIKNRPTSKHLRSLPILVTICLLLVGLLIGAYPGITPDGYGMIQTERNPCQEKSAGADVAALSLIESDTPHGTNIWSAIGFFLPYMTNDGIDEVVNRYNELFPRNTRTAHTYYDLMIPSQAETATRAESILYMSNYNFWLVEPLFPYMSEEGIEEVIAIYNDITSEFVNPSDYIERQV